MYDPSRPGGRFTGALSGGEREEIQRSLNQQRARSGGGGGPMAMQDVVANAMTFGQGVQNRRDALGRALGQATSFLPASRSGFDPFQVAMAVRHSSLAHSNSVSLVCRLILLGNLVTF